MAVAIATAAAGRFDAGQQHRELVAAEAGHRVTGAQHPAQPDRDLHQHRVAGGVPERVVHLLEAVEVDQQHADPWVSRQGGLDVSWNNRRFGRPVSGSCIARCSFSAT